MSKVNWYRTAPFYSHYTFFLTRPLLLKGLEPFNVCEPPRLSTSVRATCNAIKGNLGDHIITVELGPQKGVDLPAIRSTLIHEAVHVFQFACEHAGEDSPSPEFEAYSIQSIYCNLLSEYNAQVKRTPKKRKTKKKKARKKVDNPPSNKA